jgi:hypothetical protein
MAASQVVPAGESLSTMPRPAARRGCGRPRQSPWRLGGGAGGDLRGDGRFVQRAAGLQKGLRVGLQQAQAAAQGLEQAGASGDARG